MSLENAVGNLFKMTAKRLTYSCISSNFHFTHFYNTQDLSYWCLGLYIHGNLYPSYFMALYELNKYRISLYNDLIDGFNFSGFTPLTSLLIIETKT
jgi:hypothetical protein